MKIENAVALVTGANRGIGLAFARHLLARGARKVYAGALPFARATPRPSLNPAYTLCDSTSPSPTTWRPPQRRRRMSRW